MNRLIPTVNYKSSCVLGKVIGEHPHEPSCRLLVCQQESAKCTNGGRTVHARNPHPWCVGCRQEKGRSRNGGNLELMYQPIPSWEGHTGRPCLHRRCWHQCLQISKNRFLRIHVLQDMTPCRSSLCRKMSTNWRADTPGGLTVPLRRLHAPT